MAKKRDWQALRQQIQDAAMDKELKHQLLEVINEKKRYGLVWEESSEEAWDNMQALLPVFTEDASKRLDAVPEGSPNHVLIEGDNLNALAALSYTHAGKVDVIYIDPPYNTGNKDFVYNDSFVDKEDGYRHSKWLSFMDRRLRIAKKLLSEKGVIFISIDDNEQAQLKMLCDEVFGARNFVAKCVWQSTAGSNTGTDIVTVTEYIFVYSACREYCQFDGVLSSEDAFKYSDEYENERGKYSLDKLDRRRVAGHYSEALNFPIEMPDGALRYPGGGSVKSAEGWNYLWSKTKVQWGIEKGFIVFKKSKGVWNVYNKRYSRIDNSGNPIDRSTPFRNLITSDAFNTAQGTAEITSLFGVRTFDFPKPSKLIKQLLEISVRTHKDSTILDFFAGSGTTLHATMQLNAEDGGHRKCILVTNNENDICEKVTYERNKQVIQGYTTPKGEQVEGLAHNNLRYYKTEFAPREHSSRNRRQLAASLVDILCIKNDIYKEELTFGGERFKASVLRYFKDEAGQMLIILDERVVSTVVPMIAKVATREYPLKVYVYSDGAYAYDDEFHEVMPVIELCALPDAFLQALENDKDVLPEQKYSEAMIAEFRQNQTLAEQDPKAVAEALSDDYNYLAEPEQEELILTDEQ